MTSEERVIRSLLRKDVDRVPTFEWIIDNHVIEKLAPGLHQIEFVHEMNLDAIVVDPNVKSVPLGEGAFQDEWGRISKYTEQSHSYPTGGTISMMSDLENYKGLDPYAPGRFNDLKNAIEQKGDKAVILHLNDVYSIPSRLMPYEDFLMNLLTEPEFIKELVDRVVEINIKMAQEAVKLGLKIVMTGDDYAYNAGPMMSPKIFEELFLPGLKKVVKGYKDAGLIMIKHSDGNIMPIIDMIIDSGIDCLDPIDPIAKMDLAYIKMQYGDRIAIKGNVDCGHTLTFGSVEDTIEESKRCLEIGMQNGGYVFSSSNTIHSKVKPENYMAMLDTLKLYGIYK